MKVTVCFGNIRVVVPCGDGDLLVRDLIREATLRYKKATGKGSDSWVAVHNLQSQSGGGILDPDDRLNDVADDREQIIANFEDGDGVHHGGGDGASGSSIGTASPDIFHDPDHKYTGSSYPSRTDIEVTGEQIASGMLSVPLQVRRGSEPALHQLQPTSTEPPGPRPPALHDPTKRWSAAPIILGDLTTATATLAKTIDESTSHPSTPSNLKNNIMLRAMYPQYSNGFEDECFSPPNAQDDEPDEDENGQTPFTRITRDGSNRLSMQFLGANGTGYRWADAAERTAQLTSSKHRIHVSTSLPRDHRRKEPLGQANNSSSPVQSSQSTPTNLLDNRVGGVSSPNFTDEENTELIVIRNEPGPLGIHVVPDYDHFGKDRGLVVQGIEPGGRIDRDGKLAVFDRIIEINGQNLLNLPFQRIQEMFKLSLIATELRLKVIKHKRNGGEQLRKPPAPVYPKTGTTGRFSEDKENVAMVEVEEQLSLNTKVATVSPTKKIPAGSRNLKSLLSANTRKIGRKIELELTKGIHGLGFSITTRDNPAGGNCPIYIKNILPKGAAVEDGKLKPGDRLLEVNNIEMTGKSQAEAVAVLRNAPPGSKVKIVVSRQEDVNNGPVLPREIGADGSEHTRNPSFDNNTNVITNNPNTIPYTSSSTSNPSPPAIPPLPDSILTRNRSTPERSGSTVAKIISQFQEAVKTNHPPEKCNDDSLIFPWKHREILTFDIPVHDTEKAGLGVSVKGKTTQNINQSGSSDLGIFVKSVLHGGAASRDKRLRTNDQLLNVNGVSLLQQSNSEAMETLRRAMLHTEGPVPGNITLTVARRASSPGPTTINISSSPSSTSVNRGGAASNSSSHFSLTNSTGYNSTNEMENSAATDNSGNSESSGNTVIFLPYKQSNDSSNSIYNQSPHIQSQQLQNRNNESYMNKNSWNPVIDRITGQSKNAAQLRNESYYMATHDTWNTSMLVNTINSDKYSSPTVNLPSGEMIIIEDEYPSNISNQTSVSTNLKDITLENRNDTEPDGKASISSNICDKTTATPDSSTTGANTDVTYASQLSLENPAGFSRDAFGRQSMSEKRHATLDAKNTGTYQRNKKLREERAEKTKPKDAANLVRIGSVESIISLNRSSNHQHPEYADKLGQLGPSLGMKKSSSLESLQTMVQEIQMQEETDPAYSYRGGQGALKVIRGRGCDESFRAAVDVDYNKHLVDPNHRSETNAKKHWLLDPPENTNEREIDGFSNVRGGPRQSSLNAVLDSKQKQSGKKKPGILKGIGSMFRFGKHRKTDSGSSLDQHYIDHNIMENECETVVEQNDNETKEMEKQQIEEQQLQQLQQQQQQQHHHHHQRPRQRQPDQQDDNTNTQKYYIRIDNENNASSSSINTSSRSEKVHQLRSQHQQRHAERLGHYPNDEREEHYEQIIKQRMEQPTTYESYRQMGRPGSRSGIADPVRFNHYVNYDELQHELSTQNEQLSENQIVQMRMQVQQQRLKVEEESRKQHQYHSQRQPRSELQQRPVSNFYEYESVQSFIHSRGRQQPPQPPQHIKQQSHSGDEVNSNSLPRHLQQQQQPQPQPPHQQTNAPNSRYQHLYTQQHHHQQQQPQQRVRSYHPAPSPPYQQRYVQQQQQHQQARLRGPFVTHVTINNDVNNKSAGSKV